MIKDKLENAKIYYSVSENLKIGLEWLQNQNLKDMLDGRYEISDSVYATIQTYLTKDDAKYEAHRKYIDIQYMIQGIEKIGVIDIQNCISSMGYDEVKDLEFFEDCKREDFLTINEGEFLILYPHDAHKPSIAINEKDIVKKVVVKVSV